MNERKIKSVKLAKMIGSFPVGSKVVLSQDMADWWMIEGCYWLCHGDADLLTMAESGIVTIEWEPELFPAGASVMKKNGSPFGPLQNVWRGEVNRDDGEVTSVQIPDRCSWTIHSDELQLCPPEPSPEVLAGVPGYRPLRVVDFRPWKQGDYAWWWDGKVWNSCYSPVDGPVYILAPVEAVQEKTCRTCDTCSSQEGRHYCLLHSCQMKNMDARCCTDWTPTDDAPAIEWHDLPGNETYSRIGFVRRKS